MNLSIGGTARSHGDDICTLKRMIPTRSILFTLLCDRPVKLNTCIA